MTFQRNTPTSGHQKRKLKALSKLISISFLVIFLAILTHYRKDSPATPVSTAENSDLTSLDKFKSALDNQLSNIQVKQAGKIVKILPDDKYGPKHQRFIVQLDSGQKLLIAHNIDLAPKVDDLQVGAAILFNGEYEWNNKGGVVHWTHRDPSGSHPGGWLIFGNRKYD